MEKPFLELAHSVRVCTDSPLPRPEEYDQAATYEGAAFFFRAVKKCLVAIGFRELPQRQITDRYVHGGAVNLQMRRSGRWDNFSSVNLRTLPGALLYDVTINRASLPFGAEKQERIFQYVVDGVNADGTYTLRAQEIYTGEPELVTYGELLTVASYMGSIGNLATFKVPRPVHMNALKKLGIPLHPIFDNTYKRRATALGNIFGFYSGDTHTYNHKDEASENK